MGRARGYSPQAAATTVATAATAFGRFDAVVGARRGSVSAQAARDAEESEVLESALREMMLTINESAPGERSDEVIAFLSRAYRAGEHQPDSPGYARLRQELDSPYADYSPRRGIIQVVTYGDPPGWPGLTAPAVHELGSIMSASSGRDESLALAAAAISSLFPRRGGYDDEHYQRLPPVLSGLAAILRNVPLGCDATPCVQMATVLRHAPAKMLAGPLQPLVQAFAHRAEEENLTARERTELNEARLEQEALPESEREAFLPVVKALAVSGSYTMDAFLF